MLSIQKALDLAVRHHAAGRLARAESIYQEVLLADPSQPVALHMMGVIALHVGKNGVAVELIARALANKPDYAAARNNLGIALRNLGKLDDAVASYREALAIKPDYAAVHNNLGNALKDLGKLNDAVASYRRSLAVKPDFSEAHYNLGNALKDLGKPDDALAAYRETLAIEPDHAEALNNLGNVLKDLGRLAEAKAAFDRVFCIKHGGPWWNAATFTDDDGASPVAAAVVTSTFKLRDNMDQLEYLIAKGRIDPSFQRLADRFRAVLAEIQPGPESDTKLTPSHLACLGSSFNRVVHYGEAPRIGPGAVNGSLDFKGIEERYLSSPVSVTTLDDFLTPEALRGLRDFCLESTISSPATAPNS